MSLRDRILPGSTTDTADEDGTDTDASAEQLAASEDTTTPAPRGEHRDDDEGGFLVSFLSGDDPSTTYGDSVTAIDTEREAPPENIDALWQKYYHEFSLTGVPLWNFSSRVVEPGWTVTATIDGDEDEAMTEALEEWGQNCAIHAGEFGQDLSVLLRQLPAHRRGKGTALLEKAGTDEEPDSLAALVLHDPTTFKIYKREDKNLLTQPSDDVGPDHPTHEGKAAAYVQYDEDLNDYDDEDPVPFTVNDIVKFVWNADTGTVWGTPLYKSIDDRADALITKLEDRDEAIRMTGHPHRIYNSENWSQQEAKEFAQSHKSGETSAWEDDVDEGPEEFAGRVDFVSDAVDVEVEEGTVADIDDAVMDDVEAIFAAMPVSKFNIAYADQINQFVVEPQQEENDRRVDDERRYLERKFTPLFGEKADELAGGEYEGEVRFSIEPDREDNPLMRESFPDENLTAFANAWSQFVKAGVDSVIPPAALAELSGFDLEEFAERHGFDPEKLDEESAAVQQQMEAAAEAEPPDDDGDDGDEDNDAAGGDGSEDGQTEE